MPKLKTEHVGMRKPAGDNLAVRILYLKPYPNNQK